VWKPQDAYMGGYQKMKFLEFVVRPGNILYVPPFWHYSIQFKKDRQFVHVFNYGSLFNILSNAFNLGNHFYAKFFQDRNREVADLKGHGADQNPVENIKRVADVHHAEADRETSTL
jgi:ribosomal protein L16 Arg81 hydroxylase